MFSESIVMEQYKHGLVHCSRKWWRQWVCVKCLRVWLVSHLVCLLAYPCKYSFHLPLVFIAIFWAKKIFFEHVKAIWISQLVENQMQKKIARNLLFHVSFQATCFALSEHFILSLENSFTKYLRVFESLILMNKCASCVVGKFFSINASDNWE